MFDAEREELLGEDDEDDTTMVRDGSLMPMLTAYKNFLPFLISLLKNTQIHLFVSLEPSSSSLLNVIN